MAVDRKVAQRLIGRPVNAARLAMGLPPVTLHEHIWDGGQFAIAADELLFPPDPAWPPARLRYANFLYFDDPTPLDPELQAWLADGEPPVFVGFGSMSGDGVDRAGRIIVEAVSATGRRCIVGAGWSGLGSGGLPAGWRVVHDAPHALLERITAEGLTGAIQAAIALPQQPREVVAQRLRASDGRGEIADRVEAICAG